MIPGYPQEFAAAQNQERINNTKSVTSTEMQPTVPESGKQFETSVVPMPKDTAQNTPDQELGTKEMKTETGTVLSLVSF